MTVVTTQATRFAPFGHTRYRRHGGEWPLLHRVAEIHLVWRNRRAPDCRVRWLCGSGGARPVLLAEPNPELTRCFRCERAGVFHPAPVPCVYYAERNGRIKIGTTGNLPRRLYGLHWPMPLAVEPGSFDVERERHDQFAGLRIDQASEWFRPGADLLAHIAALNASLEPLEASA